MRTLARDMVKSLTEQLTQTSSGLTGEHMVHVLHVDDDADFLVISKRHLKKYGSFEIDNALSVTAAMKKIEQKSYDTIISDYQIFDANGLDFFKQLRANGNNTPFILFTGEYREEIAIEALTLGAERYFNKNEKQEKLYFELAYAIKKTVKNKNAETLQESESRYKMMIDHAPDIILTADNNGIVTSCNSTFERETGYSKSEVLDKSFLETPFARGMDIEFAKTLFSNVLQGKTQEPAEITWLHKDGTLRASELRINLNKKNDKTVDLIVFAHDITEQKKAEEAVHQQQEILEALARGLDVGLVMVSKDYRILWSNNTAKEDRVDLDCKKCYERMHQKTSICPDCGVKQIFEKKQDRLVTERFVKNLDGTDSWIETTITPIKDKKGNIIAALELVIPINERKKAEIALKDSEKKFRAITASANDSIILIDNEGKIVHWNPAAETMFGYTKQEVIGKNLHILLAPKQFHKKYTEGFAIFKQTGKGEVIGKNFEIEGIKKDGKVISIELSLSALKLNENWHALAIVRDNTERKTAWGSLEETINELVRINEKLGVVGRLTRHDARNKLSVILNNIYLAKIGLSEDKNNLQYFHAVESAVDQMEEIFAFARAYEMLGIEELVYSNVEKSFKEASLLFSGIDKITFVNDCPGLTVLSDSLLRQLFYNLIHNSLVHGKKVSQIQLHYKEEKEQLKLIYTDNGVGIPEDEKQKIFGEGYGKGTGYGLYLIKKICEDYGWTIHETGVLGKGAQFDMTIPKTNKEGKLSYLFVKE
ncbi:MAG: hypothetical protein CW691_01855 [Candidatus Bathyarchaeum sp.]|nr:MAG: hypothetical protein CW691_01855 [Candidatus Bathyarchaeum sp.]